MLRASAILIVLSVFGRFLTSTASTCSSTYPENSRVDCAPNQQTNEQDCQSRGCVWCPTVDYSNPNNYPWCFYGETSTTGPDCIDCTCSNKIDCYPEAGSTESGCLSRGCLWCESQIPNEPWCFYAGGDGGSVTNPTTSPGSSGSSGVCSSCSCSNKQDCYPEPGSSESGCHERGCLWCPSNIAGEPWCISSDGSTLPPSSNGCASDIPESERIDCWPGGGASQAGCQEAGCLWCESGVNGVPWCFFNTTDMPEGIPDAERVNCIPEGGFSPTTCQDRGCVYAGVDDSSAPMCYFPDSYGYEMLGSPVATATGFQIQLTRVSEGTLFGNDAQDLLLTIDFDTDTRIHWKFTDLANSNRFEVPLDIDGALESAAENPLYDFQFSNSPVFSFKITRKSTGTVLWDTSLGGLTFSDQFLQIATRVPENAAVYGFGETEHFTLKHEFAWNEWGMFSRDQPPAGVGNLYGVHPFYTAIETDGNSHGVLFLNSAAQDITFTPAPGLIYRTIGGVLDFYMFLGPEPNSVVEQYNQAIGLPFFPPYWSLGFQLCRYGYGDLDTVKQTVARMDQYDIPLDVQYGDIDYMNEQRDFTIDPVNYAGLPEFVNELHADGKHYVIILDPCLTADDPPGAYPPYERGVTADAYVKQSDGVSYALGKVWPPGYSVFPDYSSDSCRTWWRSECSTFHNTLEFDGLWIDMNEPANFQTGNVGGCAVNDINYPPYLPRIWGDQLADKTLCPDSIHAIGNHYNTHSLYGWSQAEPTYDAVFDSTGKRPFVVSRSTFPGSGKYAAHWLGDNNSQWSDLKNSVIGMLEFNLFGIPYIGADICGFNGNVEEELCRRWMQLGAFYPYSRNHNGIGYNEQDPAVFGDAFAAMARKVLRERYTLLPYLYTLFYHANTAGTGVVRPLSFEFPTDSAALVVDEQFLWGRGLLFSPVLHQGATTVDAYFPNARWFDYFTGAEVAASGNSLTINAPGDTIPIHVRGGSVIPTQDPARNTVLSRQNPFGLVVALDINGEANGDLFWDDGDTKGTIENGQYAYFTFDVSNRQLTTNIEVADSITDSMTLGTVKIYGALTNPGSVTVNGAAKTFTYSNGVISLSGLNVPLSGGLTISW